MSEHYTLTFRTTVTPIISCVKSTKQTRSLVITPINRASSALNSFHLANFNIAPSNIVPRFMKFTTAFVRGKARGK
jgi:hypothetical protein